ncbi:hypothetical protein ABDX79_10500 [Fulvimarina sp. MAC3]
MNHRAHHALEPLVEAALQRHDVAIRYQAMRHALDRDLEALAVQPLPVEVSSGPDLGGIPGLAGALYVLEGSRLGARLLHRRVAASTWVHGFQTPPLAFFEAAQASGNFSERMGLFDDLLKDGDDLETAAHAATSVFALFARSAKLARREQ